MVQDRIISSGFMNTMINLGAIGQLGNYELHEKDPEPWSQVHLFSHRAQVNSDVPVWVQQLVVNNWIYWVRPSVPSLINDWSGIKQTN
jgi:hypothetical protein